VLGIRGTLEGRLEAECEEHHDESGDKLTDTLHGKDGSHHGTTPLGGSEPAMLVNLDMIALSVHELTRR
jgi:hypothetical protein